MVTSTGCAILPVTAICAEASAASAQPQDQRDTGGIPSEDILVIGRKWQEPDIGNLPIDDTIEKDEILLLGSDTLGNLVEDLRFRTGSGRGREFTPILLINGRRAINRAEVLGLPAEAVERVQVLGERASLTYGDLPGRRVINIILKSSFRALTLKGAETLATEGGFDRFSANANYASIIGQSRLTLNVAALRDSPLLEAERAIAPEPLSPGTLIPDDELQFFYAEPQHRTLMPRNRSLKTSAAYTLPLGALTNLTLNASAAVGESDRQLGLASGQILAPTSAADASIRRYTGAALFQDQDAVNLGFGAEVSGQQGRWSWNGDLAFKRRVTDTNTELAPDFAPFQLAVDMGADPLGPIPLDILAPAANRTTSFASNSGELSILARGPLGELPAGTAWVNLRAALKANRTVSEVFTTTYSRVALSREELLLGANLQLPLASASVWKGGDIIASPGIEIREVSDFGTLASKSINLTWRPDPSFSLQGSIMFDRKAPGIMQLAAPQVTTPGVRLFDFKSGESVITTMIQQGNPDLRSEKDRNLRIGAVYQPFSGKRSLSFSFDYLRAVTTNPIGYPSATLDMQLAFPERFFHDDNGRIEAFDNSAINFGRALSKHIRTSAQWSWPIGQVEQGGKETASARLMGQLSHEWVLEDRLLVKPGVAVDYLNGDPKGFPGNVPRHRVTGKLGYAQAGLGGEIGFVWHSPSTLSHISPAPGQVPETLEFSDRLQIDLAAFVNLGEIQKRATTRSLLQGMRLRFGIENLTNSRPAVMRANGTTPYLYQPAFLLPQGRMISISLRKQF